MAKSAIKSLLGDLREEMGGVESSTVHFSTTGNDVYDIFSAGGIPHGNFIEYVGNPGCGKTTLYLQHLGALYQKDPNNTLVVIFDAERTMTDERLASFGIDPKKIILIQTGITVEKIFYDRLSKLIAKIQDEKLYVPNDPKRNLKTYVLWDSIAHTPSEKEKEVDDLNSALGVKAKVLGHVLRTYDEEFMSCNICMMAVNQLSDKINMNGPYAAKTVSLKGLGDRSVPGGKAQYFAAFHFLLIERAGDLSGTEYGFEGYIAKCQFIKNKQGVPFLEFKLVMDYKNGCDNFWTRFLHLYEAKALKQGGGWYTMTGYEDDGKLKKFRGKQAKELYDNNENFKKYFDHFWSVYAKELTARITAAGATASADSDNDISVDIEKEKGAK